MDTEMLRAPLDSGIINAGLTQYWRVSVVELTTSTQSDLIDLVTRGRAQVGDVIVAEFQSAGRGRLTRTFEAPAGSALLFSIYIKPSRPQMDWGWIPLIAGVSVAQSLPSVDARVKWPNDILIDNKKISGLIAQVVGDGIVIGIGINVGMSIEELPVPQATSLAIEGSVNTSRNALLTDLLTIFEKNFTTWDKGSNEISGTYEALSATLGREIEVHYPDGRIESGTAASISPSGELVLADGVHVLAADIIHLR
ncbi:MAG: biotin--[acetyl-CoA-carboxylase] ligase [Candidatus Planktophila sp.]